MLFYWAMGMMLPVLFVFPLAMVVITSYERRTNRYLLCVNFIPIYTINIFGDWGFLEALLIIVFWLMKSRGKEGIIYPLIGLIILKIVTNLFGTPIPVVLVLIAIFLYEKQARKRLFHLSYILIIALISLFDGEIIVVYLAMVFWTAKSRMKEDVMYPLVATAGFIIIISLFTMYTDSEFSFEYMSFGLEHFATIPLLLDYNSSFGNSREKNFPYKI